MAHLTDRIREKVDAMQAVEIARLYRARVLKLMQESDNNPDQSRKNLLSARSAFKQLSMVGFLMLFELDFLREAFDADDRANAEFERHMRTYKPKSKSPSTEEARPMTTMNDDVRDYVTKRIEGLSEGITEMCGEDRAHVDAGIAKLARRIDLLRADLSALRAHVNSDSRTYRGVLQYVNEMRTKGLLPRAVAEGDEEMGDVIDLPDWLGKRNAAA
jgi:hypothetical protein